MAMLWCVCECVCVCACVCKSKSTVCMVPNKFYIVHEIALNYIMQYKPVKMFKRWHSERNVDFLQLTIHSTRVECDAVWYSMIMKDWPNICTKLKVMCTLIALFELITSLVVQIRDISVQFLKGVNSMHWPWNCLRMQLDRPAVYVMFVKAQVDMMLDLITVGKMATWSQKFSNYI